MNDEQRVLHIRNYQELIDSFKETIRDYEKHIASDIALLPKLYYLEMTGFHGYEKGVLFAGSCDEVYQYVDTVLVNETRDWLEEHEQDHIGKQSCQVYPRNHMGRNSGWIMSCTPLDNNWQEVYELSLKVKS